MVTRLVLRPFCACIDCNAARQHLDRCALGAASCSHVEVEFVENEYFDGRSTPIRRFLADRRRREDATFYVCMTAVFVAVLLILFVLPR